jgi:hypothetical protein
MEGKDKSREAVPTPWVVERLDIDGQELPVVRHAESWLPAPLALRYALRTRFRLGASSLLVDMRAIAHAYNWSETVAEIGNLENFLVSGQVLSRDQLQSLSVHLHRQQDERVGGLVSNRLFNSRLFALGQFLEWAIEPTNNGGTALLDEDEREVQVAKMLRLLNHHKLPVGRSYRGEPLTEEEIRLIRRAIGPDEHGEFQPGIFDEKTRHRNWTMFEMVLNLGDRKSEMLTTKVKHLSSCGCDGCVFIPRQQDDLDESRKRRRPRGKTSERRVSWMDRNTLTAILTYRDAPPPVGRNDASIATPYLLVTETGVPLSISAADYVIKQIGKYAVKLMEREQLFDEHIRMQIKESLLSLTWHRVRHTWAERAALGLYKKHGEGAWAYLQEWGGWTNEKSMEHYIQHARRMINEKATREYQTSFSLRSAN